MNAAAETQSAMALQMSNIHTWNWKKPQFLKRTMKRLQCTPCERRVLQTFPV